MSRMVSLSKEEGEQLKKVVDLMPRVREVLARHADADPDAAQLHLALFQERPSLTRSRKIFLAGAETPDHLEGPAVEPRPQGDVAAVVSHLDGKGHYINESGNRHCSDCREKLASSGDPTIGHESRFGTSFRHEMAQRLVLAYPGTTYSEALEMVDRELE